MKIILSMIFLLFIISAPFVFIYILNNGNPYEAYLVNKHVPRHLESLGYEEDDLVVQSFIVPKHTINKSVYHGHYNIDINDVIQTIEKTKGIQSVHDLHVWSITSGLNALSCHVVVNDKMSVAEGKKLLERLEHDLEHKGIQHVTIQLETSAHEHEESILCTIKVEAPGLHDHHHH